MPQQSEPRSGSRTGESAALALCFLSPVMTSAAPRLTWLFLPLLAVAVGMPRFRSRNQWRELIQPNAPLIGVLLIALYVLLTAAWALDPGDAFAKGTLLLGVALITLAASSVILRLGEPSLHRAGLSFAAGASLGALFVLSELLTDGAVTRGAMNLITLLKPHSSKHVTISHGEAVTVGLEEFRRAVAISVSHLWPALLVLSGAAKGTRRAILIGLLVIAVTATVLLSGRQSAQLALFGSFVVFSMACTWRCGVVWALASLWCLSFVLVLPLAFFAYKAELHMAPWMPMSFQARIIIWEYTAERVLDHPWLGIGAASTRALREPRGVAEQPEGFVIPRSTGNHAHSLFLQTWLELGLVGAMLIAFFGAALVLRILLLPIEAQPFAAAAFAAFFATVSVAWSMWETWWMCSIGLTVLYLMVAARTRCNSPLESNGRIQQPDRLWRFGCFGSVDDRAG